MKLTHLLIGALAATAIEAQGATVLLDTTYTGAQPESTGHFLAVTTTDLANSNSVLVTIEADLESSQEFITKVGIGLVSTVDAVDLNVTNATVAEGSFNVKNHYVSNNPFNMGGGVRTEMIVNFDPANKKRFDGTDTFTFLVSNTNQNVTFDSSSFRFDEEFGVVAHVQGIDGEYSAWTHANVPEPSSALFGAIAALGLIRRNR